MRAKTQVCISLTCVWVSALHHYMVLQQLAGVHGLSIQKKRHIEIIVVFTIKMMWKWTVAKHTDQLHRCCWAWHETVICGWGMMQHRVSLLPLKLWSCLKIQWKSWKWKFKNRFLTAKNRPLGIRPVPRHVGQVSPVEVPFMAPYGGNCLSVFTFSIPGVRSGPSVVLLLIPGVTITFYRKTKSSLEKKYKTLMWLRRTLVQLNSQKL